jgi:hypothetical protein
MKGARAEPWVRIINPPNNNRKINIGASHHFFLTFKNCHNSEIIDNFDILLILKTDVHKSLLKILFARGNSSMIFFLY